MANAFQEGENDKNPKTIQIQGPMTRSRIKQLGDTLQQMVADILNKAQVEKDEDPEAEALPRILIVAEGQTNLKAYAKYVFFYL